MSDHVTRREFLKAAGSGAVCAAAGLAGCCGPRAAGPGETNRGALPPAGQRKVIIAVFGGGVRNSETIDPSGRNTIPRLWNDMAPGGTLFTNMRVEHKVVHPNSTGSIATGHREWDDIDWTRPVAHPTVFEMYRKALGADDTGAWAFVYASILSQIGHSSDASLGARYAANVVEPPTIPRATAEEMDRIMRYAASSGSAGAELDAAAEAEKLVRQTCRITRSGLRSAGAGKFLDERFAAYKSGRGTTSHDAFLTDCAVACMERYEPGVMMVAYGEIDCAHYGVWSRHIDAIRRTDELVWRLWRKARTLPAYRGKTLMLVLPDHGRELDRPGGPGWIHHSDFYTGRGADEGCRRVWMLASGPGVAAGRKIEQPVPITSVAATALEFLDLDATAGAGKSVLGSLA
ncbi:MAG: twin-arginine translocation signal domain-containing protein [Pseudomonadota bacterium]